MSVHNCAREGGVSVGMAEKYRGINLLMNRDEINAGEEKRMRA
jgi:hypothetical protein